MKKNKSNHYVVDGVSYREEFYANGCLKRKRSYVLEGKMLSDTEYFESGVISSNWENDGTEWGIFNSFYESGAKFSSGSMYIGFDDNLCSHGEWSWFYESGVIKETGCYIDNEESGVWILYNEDGSEKSREDKTDSSWLLDD